VTGRRSMFPFADYLETHPEGFAAVFAINAVTFYA
jgi:hypothetical protein